MAGEFSRPLEESTIQPVEQALPAWDLSSVVAPVTGTVGGGFGDSRSGGTRRHSAIDYQAPAGSEFVAPANLVYEQGKVGGKNLRPNDRWAHFRVLDDEGNPTPYQWRIAHQGELYEPGRMFQKGEKIGTIGNAIQETHLHAGFYNTETGEYEDIGSKFEMKRGHQLVAGVPVYELIDGGADLERRMTAVAAPGPMVGQMARPLDDVPLEGDKIPGAMARPLEQPKYGVTDAIGDVFGDAYKYIKDVLAPGTDKDLEKAKFDFLKKNPAADEATVNAAHAKLSEVSAAHQMPLGEAFAINIRNFVNGIIAPVQGINKAVTDIMPPWTKKLNKELEPAIATVNKVAGELFPPPPFGVVAHEADKVIKDKLREVDIPGKIDSFLNPKDVKHYQNQELIGAPGRVLGTLVPYLGAGKVAQAVGIPATTFFQKLLFNTATFMPVDLATGYNEAGIDGVVKALWHSPITAALFTVGGLPSGRVTSTVGIGLAGAGSAAAGGERDPAKLAEAFGTMAILHNILGTKPKRARTEVKEFIKENNLAEADVTALQDKLNDIRKQYEIDKATPAQRAPEPTPEEVQAGVDKLKQEYVAGEEAILVTPGDLSPEVIAALRKGYPLSPTQDMILQDKIKAALIGQRSAPESAAWEQHGFSPDAPGLQTPRTMASGAEPNIPGPVTAGPSGMLMPDGVAKRAEVEGKAIAEQQAFVESFKQTYEWYEDIKARRGEEFALEMLQKRRTEMAKTLETNPSELAIANEKAAADILTEKERQRAASIADEGVTLMYSGGPDTSELMRKLAPVWYSRAQRFIGEKLPNVGTGQGLANTIENWAKKGVLPGKEEVKWTGVVPWLQERRGKVTRQEVVDFWKQNGVELRVVEKGRGPTQAELNLAAQELFKRNYDDLAIGDQDTVDNKFGGYDRPSGAKFESYVKHPPGATNYREFYGVWPNKGVKRPTSHQLDDEGFLYQDRLREKYGDQLSYEELRRAVLPHERAKLDEYDQELGAALRDKSRFEVPGGHETGDPSADINRVFHAFTWDQMIGGKKYLVIGELQSDWAGEGRRKGYAGPETEAAKKELTRLRDERRQLLYDDRLLREYATQRIEAESRMDSAQREWNEVNKDDMKLSEMRAHPLSQKASVARDRYIDAKLRHEDRATSLTGSLDRQIADIEAKGIEGLTPQFPFMKNWMEVAMKKMLRRASEEGYDGLAWVSGDTVKERYDLSEVYDNVSSEKVPEGYKVTATRLDTGDTIDVGVFKDAKAMKDAGIAEDMAEKLVKAEAKELVLPEGATLELYKEDWYVREDGSLLDWTRAATKKGSIDGYYNNEDVSGVTRPGTVRLTGVDLKLGGEWANKQYDSVNPTTGEKVFGMPVFMDKYGKQWGARVGEGKIGAGKALGNRSVFQGRDIPEGKYGIYEPYVADAITYFDNEADALKYRNEREGAPVHILDITPKMKETVLQQGQYMFSGGPDTSEFFKSMRKILERPHRFVVPGIDAGKGASQGIKSLLLPTAKSPEHLRTAEVLGAKLGSMNRSSEVAAHALAASNRLFNKSGVFDRNVPLEDNPGVKFMSAVSTGSPVEPKFKIATELVDRLFKQRLWWFEKAGVPVESVRENYFPGMWTSESRRAFNQAVGEALEARPDIKNFNDWSPAEKASLRQRVVELTKAGAGVDKDATVFLSRKPLRGFESFRKGKVFEDIMTGIEFGLEPISTNPIQLVKLKLAEMDRSVMANRALREYESRGDVKFNPVTEKVPEGWLQINDRYGVVFGEFNPGTGSRPVRGYMIAKAPVAHIFNNYLSTTLYNNPYFGPAYKALMGIGNVINQAQLGVFSMFHAGFTSTETQVTMGAELIKDVYGVARGNRSLAQLGQTIMQYPTALVKPALTGTKLLSEWRNPQMEVPTDVPVGRLLEQPEARVAQIAAAAELAGAGFKLEQGLRTYQGEKMVRDWYAGDKLKAALRSPVALIELGARPIMEFLVPRQKAGVFSELAGRIMEQNSEKTLEELRPELRQAWNRVDSRLGQVRYNRLFINNAAKNVAQLGIRAPGWTFGTIAEVGGAFKDAGTFVSEWAKTGKAPADIPDRIAYSFSLLMTSALLNGMLTYAFTGTLPDGPIDFISFRDGGQDENGNPTRWVLPTYMRDLYNWYTAPKETIVHKAHPLVSAAGELWRNKDYYGEVVINPEDPLANKVYQFGEFTAKQFVPFWMRGVQKAAETTSFAEAPQKMAAPLLGVMPAGRKYTATAAQELITNYYVKRGQKEFTHEEAALNRLHSKINKLMVAGKIDEAVDLAKPFAANKQISPEKLVNWMMDASTGPLVVSRFKRLPIDVMAKVLQVASPKEEQLFVPIFVDRLQNAKIDSLEKAMPAIEEYLNKVDAKNAMVQSKPEAKVNRGGSIFDK